MLKIMIPRFKYWKSAPAGETSYPNLQDDAEGLPIPEAYGVLKNVTPVCIDTTTWKYKFSRRLLHAIDEIRDNGVPMAAADYTATPGELAVGEFSILTSPYLLAGVTYYFVIEAFEVGVQANYIRLWQFDDASYGGSIYPDGELFTISNAGVWHAETGYNLRFLICGKADLSDPWHHQIDNRYSYVERPPHTLIGLRDDNARYWLAQSFKPTANFYCTAVVVEVRNPSGILGRFRVFILNAQANPAAPGAALVGVKSNWNSRDSPDPGHGHSGFPFRTGVSNLVGDIQGLENPDTSLMENVADVLKDVYVNIIGGTVAGINAADLVTLHDARLNQDVALYLADEAEFDQTKQILEAGHLFKFLPSLGGDFAVRCLASGEPPGTPHLKKEHIRNFTMRRVWSNVFHVAKVKYYQDPTTGDWLMAEAKSDIARYLYNRQESIEIETAIKDAADAVQAAKDYLGTDPVSTRKVNLQYPTRIAEFDVLAGYGFDLIPTMKVKITLPRADYAGGALNGILFRILEVHKNPEDRSSHLVTLLDALTY